MNLLHVIGYLQTPLQTFKRKVVP